MKIKEHPDTRFFIDMDLKSGQILNLDYGNRFELNQNLYHPHQQRIFLTKGQYNKLEEKYRKLQIHIPRKNKKESEL